MQKLTSSRLASLLLCLALLLIVAPCVAQVETGQITGSVQDPTGAAVPGAKVAATSVLTKIVLTTETSPEGYYNLTNLLPGEYTVAVEAQGFSKMEKRPTLSVGARIGIDFRLEVGRTETVVEVVEASSVVNPDFRFKHLPVTL